MPVGSRCRVLLLCSLLAAGSIPTAPARAAVDVTGPGVVKVQFSGAHVTSGANVPAAPLRAVVVLGASGASDRCAEALFRVASDAPPRCTTRRQGTTLTCR